MKKIKYFESFIKKDYSNLSDINENYINNEKIVDLDIVDMDKEKSVCNIKVLFSTAKEISNALHKDRKNGGKYNAMFDENKDFRYFK